MYKKSIFLFIVLSLLLTACTESDVSLVKEGTMSGYQTTTVGNAFDASFDSPKWTAFKGAKGERVVEFNGLISQRTHDNYIEKVRTANPSPEAREAFARAMLTESEFQQMYETVSAEGATPKAEIYQALFEEACKKMVPVGNPVSFQWIVAIDGQSFSPSYIDIEPWGYCALWMGRGLRFKELETLGGNPTKNILDIIYN